MKQGAEMSIPVESSIKLDPQSADDYEVAVDETRGLVRILFRNSTGPLSYQIFTSDELYQFAQKLLKGYDKLEGLT
jgi:hypothetical protein